MSKQKMVTTVSGKTLPVGLCKKFNNSWYSIGDSTIQNSGDCYLIDNKYYRVETGLIVFDYFTQKYIIKNENLFLVVVLIEGEKIEFGYSSQKPNLEVVLANKSKTFLLSEDLIKNNLNYRERLSDGIFYHIKALPANKFNQLSQVRNEYKTSLPYDSSDVMDKYLTNYNNLNPEIDENVKRYSNLINNLSFGLEFETTMGTLPERVLEKTGLIPLRDGSISGIEYVTVPLNGEKGLQCAINSLKELKKRTRYNETCALHLHIGNVPRTKEFILALFKVSCAVQEEMFSMFPLYKKYNFGVKNKNYSKPYNIFNFFSKLDSNIDEQNIDRNFNVLYRYLSMGESFGNKYNSLENVKNHPADPENRAKWHVKTRYHWLNLTPLIFGNKQTVEFRIHTPTFDVNKIVNFLFINSLIVNYVINNTKTILSGKDPLFASESNFLNYIFNIEIKYNKFLTSEDKSYLLDELNHYIYSRIDYTFSSSKQGQIAPDEDNFKYSFCCINWSNETPIKSDLKKFKRRPQNEFKVFKTPTLVGGMDPISIAIEKMETYETTTTTRRGSVLSGNPFIGGISVDNLTREVDKLIGVQDESSKDRAYEANKNYWKTYYDELRGAVPETRVEALPTKKESKEWL